jgi:hypothetical protein
VVSKVNIGEQGLIGPLIAPTATSAWTYTWSANATGPTSSVARHWNGHRWSVQALPRLLRYTAIACAGSTSASDDWAFAGAGGRNGNGPGIGAALQLRGGRWVIVQKLSPHPVDTYVTGCNVIGSTNVWVFGGVTAGLAGGVGTWHLSGSTWTSLNTGKLVIFNASVVSPDDIWATAADTTTIQPKPVLARWNGTTWTEDSSIDAVLPSPSNTRSVGLAAIKALSDHDVWVQAWVSSSGHVVSVVVVHWNGTKWSRVKPGSRGYYLPAAVPDGHGGWWSVPYPGATGLISYLLHQANGHWTRFPLPTPLYAFNVHIAHVPHSRAMLATGQYRVSGRTAAIGVVLAFGSLPT